MQSKFNIGDKIIYKRFIDGYDFNSKLIIHERECFGEIKNIHEKHCLGAYYTYDILLDDNFALKNIQEYDLGKVKNKEGE